MQQSEGNPPAVIETLERRRLLTVTSFTVTAVSRVDANEEVVTVQWNGSGSPPAAVDFFSTIPTTTPADIEGWANGAPKTAGQTGIITQTTVYYDAQAGTYHQSMHCPAGGGVSVFAGYLNSGVLGGLFGGSTTFVTSNVVAVGNNLRDFNIFPIASRDGTQYVNFRDNETATHYLKITATNIATGKRYVLTEGSTIGRTFDVASALPPGKYTVVAVSKYGQTYTDKNNHPVDFTPAPQAKSAEWDIPAPDGTYPGGTPTTSPGARDVVEQANADLFDGGNIDVTPTSYDVTAVSLTDGQIYRWTDLTDLDDAVVPVCSYDFTMTVHWTAADGTVTDSGPIDLGHRFIAPHLQPVASTAYTVGPDGTTLTFDAADAGYHAIDFDLIDTDGQGLQNAFVFDVKLAGLTNFDTFATTAFTLSDGTHTTQTTEQHAYYANPVEFQLYVPPTPGATGTASFQYFDPYSGTFYTLATVRFVVT